jgi:hypothetical protein
MVSSMFFCNGVNIRVRVRAPIAKKFTLTSVLSRSRLGRISLRLKRARKGEAIELIEAVICWARCRSVFQT